MTEPNQHCGTYYGYKRHGNRSEQPCEACTAANAEYWRTKYGVGPRKLAPCGTYAAYIRHYRRKEKPCDACTDAARVYRQQRKQ